MLPQRNWNILLVGGASGIGKSHLGRMLAEHYRVGLVEVDDIQILLENMTTPDQYPVIHYWRTNYEDAKRMSDSQHVEFFREYSEVVGTALTYIIENHMETGSDVVIEGDFILPSRFGRPSARHGTDMQGVRSLFLLENDKEQIARNYFDRDGEKQPLRAHISWLVNEYLRAEARKASAPSISTRPWSTVLSRAIEAIAD